MSSLNTKNQLEAEPHIDEISQKIYWEWTMTGSPVRGGVYTPPEDMLPYVAVVITPQGKKLIEAFWDEKAAIEFVETYKRNYIGQLSVIGKGIRSNSPSSDE